jgi:hypothetical protein
LRDEANPILQPVAIIDPVAAQRDQSAKPGRTFQDWRLSRQDRNYTASIG